MTDYLYVFVEKHSLTLNGQIRRLSFSCDGRLLAAASKTSISIWDVESGTLNKMIADEGSSEVMFSPIEPGKICIWEQGRQWKVLIQKGPRSKTWIKKEPKKDDVPKPLTFANIPNNIAKALTFANISKLLKHANFSKSLTNANISRALTYTSDGNLFHLYREGQSQFHIELLDRDLNKVNSWNSLNWARSVRSLTSWIPTPGNYALLVGMDTGEIKNLYLTPYSAGNYQDWENDGRGNHWERVAKTIHTWNSQAVHACDAGLLAVGCSGGEIRIWDVKDFQTRKIILQTRIGFHASSLAFTLDCMHLLAIAGGRPYVGPHDG
jgi:WD40 repeat protein